MVHARREVTLPDLKGQNLRQAINVVSPLGLALIKENEEFNLDLPAGTISRQFPLPGATVREGKIIRVILSQGNEKIQVPQVVGSPLRQAEIEIRAAQLTLGEINEIYSLKQPKGSIIDQEPKPMALTEAGDLINLTISLGEPPSEKLIVPDFAGKDLSQPQSWAKINGVNWKILEQWDATGAADRTVIQQNLKPDTIVDRNPNELSKLTLELTVARNMQNTGHGRFIEYTLPNKPLRQREIVLKALLPGGERQVYRSLATPGETVKIPLSSEPSSPKTRYRIYLDGVFTEEKSWP